MNKNLKAVGEGAVALALLLSLTIVIVRRLRLPGEGRLRRERFACLRGAVNLGREKVRWVPEPANEEARLTPMYADDRALGVG